MTRNIVLDHLGLKKELKIEKRLFKKENEGAWMAGAVQDY